MFQFLKHTHNPVNTKWHLSEENQLEKKKVQHIFCEDCGEVLDVKTRTKTKELSNSELFKQIEDTHSVDLQNEDAIVFDFKDSLPQEKAEQFIEIVEEEFKGEVNAIITSGLEGLFKIDTGGKDEG